MADEDREEWLRSTGDALMGSAESYDAPPPTGIQMPGVASATTPGVLMPQGYALWMTLLGRHKDIVADTATELDRAIDEVAAEQLHPRWPKLVVGWLRAGPGDNEELDLRPVTTGGQAWVPRDGRAFFGTTPAEAIKAMRDSISEDARLNNPPVSRLPD
jgi:hypothetical protein